jgi:hypothetical protein
MSLSIGEPLAVATVSIGNYSTRNTTKAFHVENCGGSCWIGTHITFLDNWFC